MNYEIRTVGISDRGDLRFAGSGAQYFVEAAGMAPSITLPEFFYGFIGVAVAFQLVFIIISTDPQKYRPMILPSIVEKFSFAIAVAMLVYAGRTSGQIIIGAALDALLGVLFVISWFKLARENSRSART